MNSNKIIIIISGHENDWGVLRQKEVKKGNIVFDTLSVNNTGIVFINENSEKIYEYISKTIADNNNSEIYIAVHDSKEKEGYPKLKKIKEYDCVQNNENILPISFYHEDDDRFWNDWFKPFIEAVKNDINIENTFSALCTIIDNKTKKERLNDRIEKAHTIRARILYPFTTLHLALQSDLQNETIAECKNEIDNIEESLIEKLANLASNEKIKIAKIKDNFADLKNLVKKTNEKNTITEKIEIFASNLESIVNFIEFGEAPIIKPLVS